MLHKMLWYDELVFLHQRYYGFHIQDTTKGEIVSASEKIFPQLVLMNYVLPLYRRPGSAKLSLWGDGKRASIHDAVDVHHIQSAVVYYYFVNSAVERVFRFILGATDPQFRIVVSQELKSRI